MGRFINRDPKGEEGGLNLYAFCRNNGVNSWDYLGMTNLPMTLADAKRLKEDAGMRAMRGWVTTFISPEAASELAMANRVLANARAAFTTALIDSSVAAMGTAIGAATDAAISSSLQSSLAASASSSYAVASASISSSVSATLASAYGGFQQSISASIASVPVLPVGSVDVNGPLRSAGLGAGEFLNSDHSIGWPNNTPRAPNRGPAWFAQADRNGDGVLDGRDLPRYTSTTAGGPPVRAASLGTTVGGLIDEHIAFTAVVGITGAGGGFIPAGPAGQVTPVAFGISFNGDNGFQVGYLPGGALTLQVMPTYSGSVFLQVTNAGSLDSLMGRGYIIGGSGGEGLSLGADYVTGWVNDAPGGYQGFQLSLGLGGGFPVEGHAGTTYTTGTTTGGTRKP